MKIPVTYNDKTVGKVLKFDEHTGKITIELDMDKTEVQLIRELILNDAPISISCKNEPAKSLPFPNPPPSRLIRESDGGKLCPECGSSMRRKFKFWRKNKGCIQPKCKNYEE